MSTTIDTRNEQMFPKLAGRTQNRYTSGCRTDQECQQNQGFCTWTTSPFLGTISAQAHDFAEMRASRSADRYTNPGHSDRDLSNGASLQRLRLLPLEF